MKEKIIKDSVGETNVFPIRTYPKSELVHLYLPDLPIRSALHTWNEWVQFHPTLFKRLQRTGYRKSNKFFSPIQVRLIVEALGVP